MPPFMVLIHEHCGGDTQSPADTKALLDARAAYEDGLRAASSLREGERIRPPSEGRRVSRRDGVTSVPPGDSTLSGYWVVEEADLDAAVALARGCPIAEGDELEVRPVLKAAPAPHVASERGRVFAFAVLGSAADERAWVEVMDRIDEGSVSDFASTIAQERFLGGVRLDAPLRGARVAKGGRAVFDGPFLESKEVIGGLFFMRARTLDEAIEWSLSTSFVEHGALEIRELWRS